MIEIGVNNIKKTFGSNLIFKNISFELKSSEKVGLIGRNGVGKTTLFKILLQEEETEGNIYFRKGLKIGYMNQIFQYNESDTAYDILCNAFKPIHKVQEELNKIEQQMANINSDNLDYLLKKYSNIQTKYELLGGYAVDEKISKVIEGLKLDNLLKVSFSCLSGGEKNRIVLGKILLEECDVLLLDEPTNHLDFKMLIWMEEYLKQFEGSMIIISHDRYFLDHVTTKIIELHQDGLETYYGNYSYYKKEKQLRYEKEMKDYTNQEKKIKLMNEQIKRYRIWGEMRDSDKMYKKAKEIEKRIQKMDKLEKPKRDKNIRLNFQKESRTGKRIFSVIQVSKKYGDKEIFKDLNFEILYQDRITILGENGVGKSTLLKMILGEVKIDSGSIKKGSNVKIGYLSQEFEFDNKEQTVLDYYQQIFNCSSGIARRELAKMLFVKESVYKKIKVLSGGEKTKLKLLIFMNQKVNVLILDEPTNHLDIESREILERSLLKYDGTIIMVSHDRYFINAIMNKIAEVRNKNIKLYDGDYDFYKVQLDQQMDS